MRKNIVLFLVLAFSLTLLLTGCGDSKKDAAAQLTAGKEYTLKISSFAAKDEAGAKRMVELIRSEKTQAHVASQPESDNILPR